MHDGAQPRRRFHGGTIGDEVVRCHNGVEQSLQLLDIGSRMALCVCEFDGGLDVAPNVIELRLTEDEMLISGRLLEALRDGEECVVAEIVNRKGPIEV